MKIHLFMIGIVPIVATLHKKTRPLNAPATGAEKKRVDIVDSESRYWWCSYCNRVTAFMEPIKTDRFRRLWHLLRTRPLHTASPLMILAVGTGVIGLWISIEYRAPHYFLVIGLMVLIAVGVDQFIKQLVTDKLLVTWIIELVIIVSFWYWVITS